MSCTFKASRATANFAVPSMTSSRGARRSRILLKPRELRRRGESARATSDGERSPHRENAWCLARRQFEGAIPELVRCVDVQGVVHDPSERSTGVKGERLSAILKIQTAHASELVANRGPH